MGNKLVDIDSEFANLLRDAYDRGHVARVKDVMLLTPSFIERYREFLAFLETHMQVKALVRTIFRRISEPIPNEQDYPHLQLFVRSFLSAIVEETANGQLLDRVIEILDATQSQRRPPLDVLLGLGAIYLYHLRSSTRVPTSEHSPSR